MEEPVLREATVVFPLREDGAILLAKKTVRIGEGCWNGFGGGKEEGEELLVTALRELWEEAGLKTHQNNLEKIGIMHAFNHKEDGRIAEWDVHFYLARHCVGEPKETDEMITPTWFSIDNLPLNNFMPADKLWLPQAFAGKRLEVTVHYGPFQKEILKPIEIREVECFS